MKNDFKTLEQYVLQHGESALKSGRQEMQKNIFSAYL